MVLLVGVFSGPVGAGVFAATRIFAAPVQVLISAVDNTDKPKASRAMAAGGRRALVDSLKETAGLHFAIATPYLLVLLLCADLLSSLLLGDAYTEYASMGRVWAVVCALMLVVQPLETGLIVLRKGDLLFWSRAATASASICATAVLAPQFEVAGAIYALFAAWCVGATASVASLATQLRAGS